MLARSTFIQPEIQFRLLENKLPVTATYPASTQPNEQTTRKPSTNTATNKAENGLNSEIKLNGPNLSTILFADDWVI